MAVDTVPAGRAGAPAARVPEPAAVRIGSLVCLPVRRRSVVVGGALVLAVLAAGVLTLGLGELGVPPDRLLRSLGGGELAGPERFTLLRLRGPRLAVAATAGAGLGLAGALFQTVTRNPLGSPDVIGLAAGASAGAAAFGLMWTGWIPLPVGALLGAVAAMVLVFVGTGQGFASPARMLIVGIGVNAMALATVQWIITRSSREQATVVAAYINGSTASRSWGDARLMVLALAVLLPLALALTRRLQLVELGDELAGALGADPDRTRIAAVLVAIGAATAAVTVVGPVAFVALTAPQVARRLTRTPGPNLVASVLTGAWILVVADLVVQHGPESLRLPVGVLTAAVGGLYLGYLLVREWRRVAV